jgi:hypothetical protein
MRKLSNVAIAIVAALALFVGVFAYPVVAGNHPLSVSSGAPATAGHPRTADSSGNETNDTEFDDHQGSSTWNETENGTAENETGDHSSSDLNETENETGSASPDQGSSGTSEDSSSGTSGVDLASVESSIVSGVDSFAADLVSGIHLATSAPVL